LSSLRWIGRGPETISAASRYATQPGIRVRLPPIFGFPVSGHCRYASAFHERCMSPVSFPHKATRRSYALGSGENGPRIAARVHTLSTPLVASLLSSGPWLLVP